MKRSKEFEVSNGGPSNRNIPSSMPFRITSDRKECYRRLSKNSYIFFIGDSVPVLGSALTFEILLSYSYFSDKGPIIN